MLEDGLHFVIFWGMWLLIPALVDGTAYLLYLTGLMRRPVGRAGGSGDFLPPRITVIIPVYNGEATLEGCLESIRRQDYPQELVQLLVVDNGSTDGGFGSFERVQERAYGGQMYWIQAPQKGKVFALNTGIHLASGSIMINVDCDTVLAPGTLLATARAFHDDPQLAAATGTIEVLPPDRAALPGWRVVLAECEALEYMTAFRIGRRFQARTDAIFTLAGAFSAFRTQVLLDTFLYDQSTVSEDTKLTLDLRERCRRMGMSIGYVEDAVAYVSPTESLARLSSQRVRWQRGAMEVTALHQPGASARTVFSRGLSLPRILLADHTLVFPRLVWTFLLPTLTLMGYSPSLVVDASLGMYLFYSGIEALGMATCYLLSPPEARHRLRGKQWYLPLVMPAYRTMLFWFRLGGFLEVMTEDARWSSAPFWRQSADALADLKARVRLRPG